MLGFMSLVRSYSAICVGALATFVGACERRDPEPTGEGATSASAMQPAPATSGKERPPVADGIPVDTERVLDVVNSQRAPAYRGPTGGVRGLVTASGDKPPALDIVPDKLPDGCDRAREVYGHLFREGMLRSLGDVLVTVTGYDGYLPAKNEAVRIVGAGCAWQHRTIALMFGQRLEVANKGRRAITPELVGANSPALMVAVPNGGPVPLYPSKPGRYLLREGGLGFMQAEVLVVKYPTHDVTGLDGRFEITGIPVGEVTVTAFLPATAKAVEKKVRIIQDQVLDVDLEIPFDAKAHRLAQRSTSGSASAAAPAARAPKPP
jgi:hypothetical protein